MADDFFVPSPEWKRILETDPPPENPFHAKWAEFGKDCRRDPYSCIFCGKCPSGDNWHPPEEDVQSLIYQRYLRDNEAWKQRNPNWLEAWGSSELVGIFVEPEKESEVDWTQNTLENAQRFVENQDKRVCPEPGRIGDKHFLDIASEGAEILNRELFGQDTKEKEGE